MSKYIPLSEQLRRAILASGKTRYRIAKETGIGQDQLSRFVNGKCGLTMEVSDTIGKYLRLRIVADKPKPKTKGK